MRSFYLLSLLFALSIRGPFCLTLSVYARNSGHALLQTTRHKPRGQSISIAASYLSNDTVSVAKLNERADFSGVLSWYNAGLGACGGTNSDNDFIVALNVPQWDGGSHCYEMITISYQGKTATAQVVDQCQQCPYSGLDLTHGLFAYLAGSPEQIGTFNAEWSWGAGGSTTSTTPSTSTTSDPPKHSSTSSSQPPPTTTSPIESTRSSFSSSSSSSSSTSATSSTVRVTSVSSSSPPTSTPTIQGPETLQQFDIAVVQIAALLVDALSFRQ